MRSGHRNHDTSTNSQQQMGVFVRRNGGGPPDSQWLWNDITNGVPRKSAASWGDHTVIYPRNMSPVNKTQRYVSGDTSSRRKFAIQAAE